MGATGPAMMGRPLRSGGQGIWIYSELHVSVCCMISLHLWTFGLTYMLLDFQFLLLMYRISDSRRPFEYLVVYSFNPLTTFVSAFVFTLS